MNRTQFRDHVLDVLREEFPDREFGATDDVQVLSMSNSQLGLQNLFADYQREDLSGTDLDERIKQHFNRILDHPSLERGADSLPWHRVQERLRLQLMPAEFCDQVSLVHFPLVHGVLVGLVVDSEDGYAYVREEEPIVWGKTADELRDLAGENLHRISEGIEMSFIPPPNTCIAIETKDGYDAARLLVPGIRELATEKLGEPFFAAIPNRDFLFMWSEDNSAEFQKFVREKVAKDFAAQSHPLTSAVLRVSADAISAEG